MIIMSKFNFGKVESDSSYLGLALGYIERAKTLLESIVKTYSRSLDREMEKIVKEYQGESNRLYSQYMKENMIYVCVVLRMNGSGVLTETIITKSIN